MESMGYIAALFIGISLGLIGGGGSILTVPVLVYLFGVSPIVATSYSLFVVGSTSLVGSFNSYRKGWVDMKTALLFGISSIVTVFITRKLIIPLIPEQFSIAGLHLSFSFLTMVLFAILMLVASVSMIRGNKKIKNSARSKNIFSLLLYGIGIGLITGFLGAGGGFLLIPALVIIFHFPMKKAIGTSLLIIALNSLAGFLADLGQYNTNWNLLIAISSIAIAGVFIGGVLSKRIHGEKLKKGFGWFVLLMGIYIIVKETLLK
jgi:uncharacterized membrane protein YfcA